MLDLPLRPHTEGRRPRLKPQQMGVVYCAPVVEPEPEPGFYQTYRKYWLDPEGNRRRARAYYHRHAEERRQYARERYASQKDQCRHG